MRKFIKKICRKYPKLFRWSWEFRGAEDKLCLYFLQYRLFGV